MELKRTVAVKKKGVVYAATAEGVELPVIDVTHPAFALDLTDQQLEKIALKSIRNLQLASRLPVPIKKIGARISPIVASSLDAEGSFLSGMATYLYKLGPEHLESGLGGWLDRRFAAGIGAISVRLRLQDMAQLLVSGLKGALLIDPKAPMHLINIAGGPSMDSINALLLLRQQAPQTIAKRRIIIHVLDRDHHGPFFCEKAVAALRAEGAPLCRSRIDVEHLLYDWQEQAPLATLLEKISMEKGAIVAVSSEGGLFEYATDDEIVKNLRTIRATGNGPFLMVGSSVKVSDTALALKSISGMGIRPMAWKHLVEVAAQGGWIIRENFERNPIYHTFSLR